MYVCVRVKLPCMILLALILGLLVPGPGRLLAEPQLDLGDLGEMTIASSLFIIIIFLVQGMSIHTKEITNLRKQLSPILYGIPAILGFTALIGFIPLAFPLANPDYSAGLAVMLCNPTTVSTGVILTEKAGGLVSLSITLTVITNLLGVVCVHNIHRAFSLVRTVTHASCAMYQVSCVHVNGAYVCLNR